LKYHPLEGQIDGGYTFAAGHTDHLLDGGGNVGFGLTWHPTSALPIGLRVDGSYSSFEARNALLQSFGPDSVHGHEDVYGGDADLQLDLAHSSSRTKFYLFGGAGWYREATHIRQVTWQQGTVCGFYYCQQGTFPFGTELRETTDWKSAWNAGLGWEVAYADGASFFIEARYLQIGPLDSKQQFVPVRVGLRF